MFRGVLFRSEAARATADASGRSADSAAQALRDLEARLAAANAALDTATIAATGARQLADLHQENAGAATREAETARTPIGDAERDVTDAEAAVAWVSDRLVQAETMLDSAIALERHARDALDEAHGSGNDVAAANAEAALAERRRVLHETEQDVDALKAERTAATRAASDARSRLDELNGVLRTAVAAAAAARKLADDAAREADEAIAIANERTRERDDLAERAEEARAEAEARAAEAEADEVAATVAEGAASTAETDAATMADDRSVAAARLSDAMHAEESAAAALDNARSDADAAEAALAEAEIRLAEATTKRNAAAAAADDAKQALADALAAADRARADLDAAQAAADTAIGEAIAAEMTARAAANRAAALPAGWRPSDQRADSGGAPAAVTAVETLAPSLAAEPEPSPIDLVPVTPRLRPSRPPAVTTTATDLGLPSDGRPLTISQP